MYAWRAKIGVIKPLFHGKTLANWYSNAPEGVEITPAIIGLDYRRPSTKEELEAALDTATGLARRLVEAECDAIVLGGVPLTVTRGIEFERQWAQDLENELGVVVIPPVEPYAQAMLAMGAKRAAVASYFNQSVNDHIVKAMEYCGLPAETLQEWTSGEATSDAMPVSHTEASRISPDDVYQFCVRGIRRLAEPVDGLFVMGGFDSRAALGALRTDLRMPVITHDICQMWACYQRLGVALDSPDYSELLSLDAPALVEVG